jgi:hypothetical protein
MTGSQPTKGHALQWPYVLLLVLLCAAGCGEGTPPNDTWLTESPIDAPDYWDGWDIVKSAPVQASQLAAAVKALEEVSFVLVTPAEAEKLTGEKRDIPPGTMIYLVRAMTSEGNTGKCNAHLKGDALLTHYGTLGWRWPKFTRLPRVVYVPRKINKVFVRVSCDA